MDKTCTMDFTLDMQHGLISLMGMGNNGYELENEGKSVTSISQDGVLTQSIFKRKMSGERFQVTVIKLDDNEA
jgi:hypothetical protein